MGRIRKAKDNLFKLPKGSFLRNGAYVYINTSNNYISSDKRKNGGKGYTGHDSVCIGVLQDPKDKTNKMFYANDTYRKDYLKVELPDPPMFSDCVAVGFNDWVSTVIKTCFGRHGRNTPCR